MPLHIIHDYEAITIEQIVLALYGGPGLGKTTIGFTAEDPLCLDFDGGSYRAKNRKAVVRVSKWADVATMQAGDVVGYKSVIVDTAGRALDRLSEQLIRDDPKNSTPAGALSLQGYGALKAVFVGWLNRLKSFGVDPILIAHSSEERKGEDIIERLDVQGGSRGEIHKSADAMGRLYISQGGERILNFSPSDAAFGKNPAQLEPLIVPHWEKDPKFLAGVIGKIKGSLNAHSEAVRAMREKIEKAREVYVKLADAEAFTKQATELASIGAESSIKMLLLQVAAEKGFTFDREKKLFVPTPAPAEQPAAAGAEQQQQAPAASRPRGGSGGRRRQS